VGRNSSGKSTFLRAFPLLRQSVETATESPILWYRADYVDFGSIQDAINDRSNDRRVTFEFSLMMRTGMLSDARINFSMALAEAQPTRRPYVESMEIRVEGNTVRLSFAPDGRVVRFTVNTFDAASEGVFSLDGAAFLVPRFELKELGRVLYHPAPPYDLQMPPPFAKAQLLGGLIDALSDLFHGHGGREGIAPLAQKLQIGSPEAMLSQLKTLDGGPYFKKKVAGLETGSDIFVRIADRVVASSVPLILYAIDRQITHFVSRIAYLAPLRAGAERSYRIQDLSVGEVDPRGQNLAMFLRSLSDAEASSLAAFSRTYLGFEPKIQTEKLHAEIRIQEPGASRHLNLIDIGFGYSQVLPLTAILWSSCCRQLRTGQEATSLLAIEQPELHLHPAYQARLARMIAAALIESRKAEREVRLMVETHSEALVNGLGKLIRKGMIADSDVQIVLFEQDDETRQTSVRLAGYDEEGALRNWPFGFFAPVADD
jgi:predicted ATPase